MARRGRLPKSNPKSRTRDRIRSKKAADSDDSDEDYVIEEDDVDDEIWEELCNSSSESSDSSFKVGRVPSRSKSSKGPKRRRNGRSKRSKSGASRGSRVLEESESEDLDDDDDVVVDEEEEEEEEEEEDGDEEFMPGAEDCAEDDDGEESGSEPSAREFSEGSFDFSATSCSSEGRRAAARPKRGKKLGARKKKARRQRKNGVSKDLGDSEEEEDDDEEFLPNATDYLDDEDEVRVGRKGVIRNRLRNGSAKKGNLKQNSKKRRKRKRGRRQPKKEIVSDDDFVVDNKVVREKKSRLRAKKPVSSDEDFVVKDKVARENNRTNIKRRRRRAAVNSDSDFADSGSSDFELVVSEEERDFIRELAKNGDLISSLQDSSVPKRLRANGAPASRTCAKKGKEKVDEVHVDAGKQVCGICLSEEQQGTVRGTLNSCFHFFCLTCIMEWSKVESRCPVCKQRFTTISKAARSGIGIGLRKTVIQVPRRDQVYRPSEEELRDYLDPYENVVCMECQQGGDDSLMLLCDICDSPAHTYCVGLGREVPEGNWYCEGCRSSAPVSSNFQNMVSDLNIGSGDFCLENSYSRVDAESSDAHLPPFLLSQHSLPEQSHALGIDVLASSRCPAGDNVQSASPRTGAGPSTVSERRRLRRRIHNLISSYRMTSLIERDERSHGLPHASLANDAANSLIELNQVLVENANSLGTGNSHPEAIDDRVWGSARSSVLCNESPSCSVQNGDAFSSRGGRRRRQVIYDLNSLPSNGPMDDIFSAKQEQHSINSVETTLHPDRLSQPALGSDAHILPYTSVDGCSCPLAEEAKEQVRDLVKRHLKLLSRDKELDYTTFRDIARRSTHTILASCGYEHNISITIPFQPPSACFHAEKEWQQTCLNKDCCSSCFDSYVKDVVLRLLKLKLQ